MMDNLGDGLVCLDVKKCSLMELGRDLLTLLTTKEVLPVLASLSVTLYFLAEEFLDPEEEEEFDEQQDAQATSHEPTPPPSSSPVPSDFQLPDDLWICRHCTLINEAYNDRCDACNGQRNLPSQNSPPSIDDRKTSSKRRARFHCPEIGNPLSKLDIQVYMDDENGRKKECQRFRERNPETACISSPTRKSKNHRALPLPTPSAKSDKALSKFFSSLIQSLPLTLIDFTFTAGDDPDYTIQAKEDSAGEGSQTSKPPKHVASFSLTDSDAEALGSSCPNLTDIELNSVRLPSSAPFATLLATLPSLSTVAFSCDTKFSISTSTGDLLSAISSAKNALTNLRLVINNPPKNNSTALLTTEYLRDPAGYSSQREVQLRSPSLEKLWLEGCSQIEKVMLQTPYLERLHISNCCSLLYFGFSSSSDSSNLRDMRIARNSSLLPQCIPALNLPKLCRLEVSKMTSLNDFQLGELLSKCITSVNILRLRSCRALGDCICWLSNTGFRPLCVLDLEKPGPSFDLPALRYLLENATNMKELKITDAAGLADAICESTDQADFSSHQLTHDEGGSHYATNIIGVPTFDAALASTAALSISSPGSAAYAAEGGGGGSSSASTLGTGAMHGLEQAEHLGLRSIQRTLHNFINTASLDQEYGFPPTLSSFQRKMVHDVAEQLDLEHESLKLRGNGCTIVKIRRKRRTPTVINVTEDGAGNERTVGSEIGAVSSPPSPAVVGSLGSALEEHHAQQLVQHQRRQQQQLQNEDTGIARMSSMWDQPLPAEDEEESSPSRDLFGRDNTVNFNDDIEEFSDEDDGARNSDRGGEDLFQLDVDEASAPLPPSPPHPTSRRASRIAEKERRKREKAGDVDLRLEEGVDEGSPKSAIPHGGRSRGRSISGGGGRDSSTFFDKNLQCEIPPDANPKVIKRLIAVAHQLPRENGKAICLLNTRNMCVTRNCKYAHFDMKKGKDVKKFSALIEFVCYQHHYSRRESESSSNYDGGNGNNGSRKSPIGGTPRSCGSAESESYMERFMGSGKKKSKKEKQREQYEKEDSFIVQSSPKSPSDFMMMGSSPMGTSPGFSPSMMISRVGLSEKLPTPLFCGFLISLTLNDCGGVKVVSLLAPVLARFIAKRCGRLGALDLRTPKLNYLDVTDCSNLGLVTLQEKSMRGLRVAKLSGCKLLNEPFVHKLVGHCKGLRQLHIYGSGAASIPSNERVRRRLKTKKGLEKIKKENPKLEVITTKEQNKRNCKKDLETLIGEKTKNGFGLSSP